MNKKTLTIIIGSMGAVETATNTILGLALPEDKKVLVIGIVSAVFACAGTICTLFIKNMPETK